MANDDDGEGLQMQQRVGRGAGSVRRRLLLLEDKEEMLL
jgi:hypothetical protein